MSAKGTVLKRVRQSRKANAKNKHYKSIVKSVLNIFVIVVLKSDNVISKNEVSLKVFLWNNVLLKFKNLFFSKNANFR